MKQRAFSLCVFGCLFLATFIAAQRSESHEKSRKSFLRQRLVAQAKAAALAEDPADAAKEKGWCELTIDLVDAKSETSLAGIVRITNRETGKALQLSGEIHRALNWFTLAKQATVKVPQTKVTIEALQGLETELASREVDLTGLGKAAVKLTLKRFFDASADGLQSGNTHLHLMKLTHAEAIRYLQLVPKSDGLDLVFLSHLRRIPDERNYISNEIVENSFTGGSLQRLSQGGVLFSNGEEHRHNFGRGGEGWGHVMLLDILKLIQPVSIGPGIMREGTDRIPLQHGIKQARADGGTVIWCHNTFGFEDIPNWVKGLVHAQNIYDGSPTGDYDGAYYRYLNLGLKVPFSTGTDWFIYDFARVYVPVEGELTSKKWLGSLRAGRSFITNGPLLELTADDAKVGDTIALSGPKLIEVEARGVGRQDFHGLELIYNGEVVHHEHTDQEGGHYECDTSFRLKVDEPGWIALRIPLDAGKSGLDRPLYAHTSPIYVEIAGKRVFRGDVAEELLQEIMAGVEVIKEKADFADDKERNAVLDVHREGIDILQSWIDRGASSIE